MAKEQFYDVDADKSFKHAMDRAARSELDLSFSMGESVRIIKKESTKNFTLKGSGKYEALNPSYLRSKKIHFPGAPILVGSGKLRDSIIGNTGDTILSIRERSVEFGTKAKSKKGAPYPVFVQKGTKKMASRKFLFFSKAMVKQIVNTINSDIKNQL